MGGGGKRTTEHNDNTDWYYLRCSIIPTSVYFTWIYCALHPSISLATELLSVSKGLEGNFLSNITLHPPESSTFPIRFCCAHSHVVNKMADVSDRFSKKRELAVSQSLLRDSSWKLIRESVPVLELELHSFPEAQY